MKLLFPIYFLFVFAMPAMGQNAYSISGAVRCSSGTPLSGVILQLSYANSSRVDTFVTDAEGRYQFQGLSGGGTQSYTLTLYYDDPDLLGLSTFDVVVIARDILEIQPLEPLQRLAADYNRNGKVTTLDMVLMRQAILQVQADPQFRPDWLFTPENTVTPGPLTISNLQQNRTLNFVGIKRGDMNGSACQ